MQQGTEASCGATSKAEARDLFIDTDNELRQTDIVGHSTEMDDSTFPRRLPNIPRDKLEQEL